MICTMEVHSMLDDAGDSFSLPYQLAKFLGYELNQFEMGTHVASRASDEKAYKAIGGLEDLWFIMREIVPMQAFMDEPENMELDSVIENVNKALETIEYRETVSFYYYKGTLGFKLEADDVTVTLPDVVNLYFGFPVKQMFRSGVRMPLKKLLVPEEDRKHLFQDTNRWPEPEVAPTQVLVLSSICANQHYENQPLPLLRQLDMPIADDTILCKS